MFDALPGEKIIKPIEEVVTLDGFDIAFVGFPVMQFSPPRAAREFLKNHAAGKKIAVFVTHAMPTGSDDLGQQSMLAKELEKCRSACIKSDLLGLFHCQGELSEKSANELMASNIAMLMEFAAMRPLTAGHPDQGELELARSFALAVVSASC